jgi:hypothetical protein
MPRMVADESRCLDDGQEISFEGTLESMWHTSILIEVSPCNDKVRDDCLPEEERIAELKNIKFFATFTT